MKLASVLSVASRIVDTMLVLLVATVLACVALTSLGHEASNLVQTTCFSRFAPRAAHDRLGATQANSQTL